MRYIQVVLIGVLLMTSCATQRSDGWESFHSDHASLDLNLPCSAKETRKDSLPYAAGERFGYEWACEAGPNRYVISYGDHDPGTPETVETFLNYSKGDAERAFKDLIREESEISIDGKKAFKFLIVNEKGGALLQAVTANRRGLLRILMLRKDASGFQGSDRQIFEQILSSVKFADE